MSLRKFILRRSVVLTRQLSSKILEKSIQAPSHAFDADHLDCTQTETKNRLLLIQKHTSISGTKLNLNY
jgi:hypothetical protein